MNRKVDWELGDLGQISNLVIYLNFEGVVRGLRFLVDLFYWVVMRIDRVMFVSDFYFFEIVCQGFLVGEQREN